MIVRVQKDFSFYFEKMRLNKDLVDGFFEKKKTFLSEWKVRFTIPFQKVIPPK